MMAPIMERTPSDIASTKPPRFMSLRGRNMAAATHSATTAPMHRPMTGFSPTAVAKSTPLKKPPMYIMPRIENTMSTRMGTMRSQMVPRSEMFRPLYSSMAPAAASSMSPSSVTTVGMFGAPSKSTWALSAMRARDTASSAEPSAGMRPSASA